MNAEDNIDKVIIFGTTHRLRCVMRRVPNDYHSDVLMYAVDAVYLDDPSVIEDLAHQIYEHTRSSTKDECEAFCLEAVEAVGDIIRSTTLGEMEEFMEWTEVRDVEALYNERFWVLRVDGDDHGWH